jgi:hypothetical protein
MNKIIALIVLVLLSSVICCKKGSKAIDMDENTDEKYNAKLIFEEKEILLKDYEDTDEVVLIGKIELRDNYGLPNYGENPETDTIEIFYYFIPNDGIVLEYNFPNNKDGILIREIQIVADPSILRDIYKSEYVYEIKGNLFMAHTGHHHTPVLIMLKEINIIDF